MIISNKYIRTKNGVQQGLIQAVKNLLQANIQTVSSNLGQKFACIYE